MQSQDRNALRCRGAAGPEREKGSNSMAARRRTEELPWPPSPVRHLAVRAPSLPHSATRRERGRTENLRWRSRARKFASVQYLPPTGSKINTRTIRPPASVRGPQGCGSFVCWSTLVLDAARRREIFWTSKCGSETAPLSLPWLYFRNATRLVCLNLAKYRYPSTAAHHASASVISESWRGRYERR